MTDPPAKPDEERYSAQELQDNAWNLLRQSRHAVVGALAGEQKRKTFTRDEASKLVERFLKREVSTA